MLRSLTEHWPEYLMEAAELGAFMVAAGLIGTVLEFPESPLHTAISDPTLRRFFTGIAMGATAIAIIYSPWGKRSGAHFNPAVTFTFFRLGKIATWDATFYISAQFLGGVAGVVLVAALLGAAFEHPPVNFVATVPGPLGQSVALVAEVMISFVLMLTILFATNARRIARYTGVFAGLLVAVYITVEGPLSGMSMNPARTFGSALPGHIWSALWIYFAGPTLGMLAAAEAYVRVRGAHRVVCAKLHHDNDRRCIFRCGYKAEAARQSLNAASMNRPRELTV